MPTFKDIGFFAPAILTVLRFLQGFAVGGEWGGATLMAVEHAPEESRNFYWSWPQLGVPGGLMLSTGIFAMVSSLTNKHFRLGAGEDSVSVDSAIRSCWAIYPNARAQIPPAFARVKDARAVFRLPVLELFLAPPIGRDFGDRYVLRRYHGLYVSNTFALCTSLGASAYREMYPS